MAALLNVDVNRGTPVPARLYVPPVRPRPAVKSAVRRPTRPGLIMQWRVGSGGRPTASWLSEAAADLKNPDD